MLSLQGKYSILKKRTVAGRDEYGILVIYDIDGFADSFYNAWVWKILSEKSAKGNQLCIWIPYNNVYEKSGYMDIWPLILWKTVVQFWENPFGCNSHRNAPGVGKTERNGRKCWRDSVCYTDDSISGVHYSHRDSA